MTGRDYPFRETGSQARHRALNSGETHAKHDDTNGEIEPTSSELAALRKLAAGDEGPAVRLSLQFLGWMRVHGGRWVLSDTGAAAIARAAHTNAKNVKGGAR